jgi:hypothetical protein
MSGVPPARSKRIQSVISGFAGGLAPFAINLAQTLVSNSDLTITPGYFVGILIFGMAGAGMAYVFRELNLAKAFFLGISAPAMIALAAKGNEPKSKASGSPLGHTSIPWVSVSLISSAYAQEVPRSPSQPINGRTLEIQLVGTMPEATVVFRDTDGKQLKTEDIKLYDFEQIPVPPTATSMVVRYRDNVTNPYPLSSVPDQTQYVEVIGTEGRKVLDISSAFTGAAKTSYSIRIAAPSTAPLPKGQVGWVLLGAKSNGTWQTRYLDFATDAPELGAIFHPQADLTMRASPIKTGARIGRVKKGQLLKLLQFISVGPGAEANDAEHDGTYYAQVKVL